MVCKEHGRLLSKFAFVILPPPLLLLRHPVEWSVKSTGACSQSSRLSFFLRLFCFFGAALFLGTAFARNSLILLSNCSAASFFAASFFAASSCAVAFPAAAGATEKQKMIHETKSRHSRCIVAAQMHGPRAAGLAA